MELSPYNSATTMRSAPRRRRATFRPLAGYPWADRRVKRGPRDAVAEVTVPHAVPDAADHVTLVERLQGGVRNVLWRRG